MPSAGGDYVYLRYLHGDFVAFLYAYTAFVALNPCFYAVLALTTSYYLFKPFFPDCEVPQLAVSVLSIWIISKCLSSNILLNNDLNLLAYTCISGLKYGPMCPPPLLLQSFMGKYYECKKIDVKY